jgi:hypothetical protein
MLAAFFVVAPYTLLDLPTFLNQFARLASEYRSPPSVIEPIWIIYLKHLRNALQWPGGLIVAGGIVCAVLRMAAGPERLKWTLATLFPVVYFWFISRQHIVYGRYLLPLLPFLSLLAAALVVAVGDMLRQTPLTRPVGNAVTVVLAVLAIAPPAYTSIAFDRSAAKVWTTEQAYDWILRSIPPGSTVTLESRQILLPATYKAAYVGQLRQHPYERYVAEGVEYLVASSQCYGAYMDVPSRGPQTYPEEYAYYMRIFREAVEVARFTPTSGHPGPELRIFRIVRVTP